MNSTVIWVYGCHESPYLLPIFLTPRVFSLEFIKAKNYIRDRALPETTHDIQPQIPFHYWALHCKN
jgi:hypothetical protein